MTDYKGCTIKMSTRYDARFSLCGRFSSIPQNDSLCTVEKTAADNYGMGATDTECMYLEYTRLATCTTGQCLAIYMHNPLPSRSTLQCPVCLRIIFGPLHVCQTEEYPDPSFRWGVTGCRSLAVPT